MCATTPPAALAEGEEEEEAEVEEARAGWDAEGPELAREAVRLDAARSSPIEASTAEEAADGGGQIGDRGCGEREGCRG